MQKGRERQKNPSKCLKYPSTLAMHGQGWPRPAATSLYIAKVITNFAPNRPSTAKRPNHPSTTHSTTLLPPMFGPLNKIQPSQQNPDRYPIDSTKLLGDLFRLQPVSGPAWGHMAGPERCALREAFLKTMRLEIGLGPDGGA